MEDARLGARRPPARRPGHRSGRRGRRALTNRTWIVLGGIVAVAAGLLALGATQVKEWTVMTDELLYAKLAQHIGETGSPLPVLHGEHAGFLGVVYPILLAPFYGSLSPVAAFDAGHVVNAVLFASAAIPVFLLARRIVPPDCALVVALLSVAVPWAANTTTLMSESAAYPVFCWAMFACHGALVEPSPRRDLFAIGALALAFFTRPQFLVLAAVFVLAAVVVDERRVLQRHRVLTGACVLAILVVVPLAALGQAHRLLGDYGVTATEGSLLPASVWKSAVLHVDVVAVGLGVLPFLLGAAWVYSNLRAAAPARAFAALAAFALPLLTFETASYDVRFGGSDVIRDRYLFYLAPLLLLASAAALVGRISVRGVVGATAFFAATVAFAAFPRVAGESVDSAESVLNGVIRDVSPGLPTGVFVSLCGIAFGVVCLAFTRLPAPAVMLGVALFLFGFGGSTAGYAFHRLLSSRNILGYPVTGQSRVRDWIDPVVGGRSVALLAYPISRDWGQSAEAWWEAEFWNASVRYADEGPNGHFTYTPFRSRTLRVDAHGVVVGSEHAPKFVLVAPGDSRFGLVGEQVGANMGLRLLKLKRPWHVSWTSSGLDADGFTRPGRTASIRVFGGGANENVGVTVTLDAPPEAQGEVRYEVGGSSGSIAPGARAGADVVVCVPAGGHADVPLRSARAATIAGPPFGPEPGPSRDVGVVMSGVQVSPTGDRCTP